MHIPVLAKMNLYLKIIQIILITKEEIFVAAKSNRV